MDLSGRRVCPQLHDRDLRRQRVDAADPRPHAGDPGRPRGPGSGGSTPRSTARPPASCCCRSPPRGWSRGPPTRSSNRRGTRGPSASQPSALSGRACFSVVARAFLQGRPAGLGRPRARPDHLRSDASMPGRRSRVYRERQLEQLTDGVGQGRRAAPLRLPPLLGGRPQRVARGSRASMTRSSAAWSSPARPRSASSVRCWRSRRFTPIGSKEEMSGRHRA
jgi:hypothetical protein